MARPQKQTVDYYPHEAVSGKTILIIETNFGNDGYAFFHKLLEYLCDSDGHFIDCTEPGEWEYLLAKTRVNSDVALKIINLLVDLNKLDGDLWKKGILWYQALVDNIADVYKNRKKPIPSKPDITNKKDVSIGRNNKNINITTFLPIETLKNNTFKKVSTDENRQIKLNKTKLNKTTTNNIQVDIQDSEPCILDEVNKKAKDVVVEDFDFVKYFAQKMPIPNRTYAEKLQAIAEDYSNNQEWLVHATDKYFLAGAGKPLSYLESILRNWRNMNTDKPWTKQWKTPIPGSEWANAQQQEKVKKPRDDCPKCKGEGYIIDLDDMSKPALACDCWGYHDD